jgi:uncharacterized protein (TIGR02284 family)
MDDAPADRLATLHTNAIDARNGYREALRDAEGHGLTTVFEDMIVLHDRNADELAAALTALGEATDDEGSFMTAVHRTIMDIRGLFGGLGPSVLPGLIDGETRNLAAYDEALATALPAETQDLLTQQRARIAIAVAGMRAQTEEGKG